LGIPEPKIVGVSKVLIGSASSIHEGLFGVCLTLFQISCDMHFLSPILENYVALCSEPEPALLQELSRETHLKVLRPRMITGHHQGRLLSFFAKIMRPQTILEIGTYTGYSALCLAEGLPAMGQLHTIDKNQELLSIQRKYFEKSGHGTNIFQHTGMALEILPKMELMFDLVFVDAEKSEYPQYLECILPKVRTGGLILFDNVLWSGKVLERYSHTDQVTSILDEFNRKLPQDPRLSTLLLPIRDGLTVCMVK
jgi:predicted O-methyltransferase YrrM